MTRVRPRMLHSTLALLAALSFTACVGPSSVAVGAALSGSFVNATRLAIEDAVAAGGLPGLDTLLLHETTNAAAPAIGMAEQFIALPGIVAVIGHSNSAASLAASQTYNDAGVVQIAPTSTAVRYADAGPFSFRMVPADPKQGELLAAAVTEARPSGARVALHYVNDAYGRGLREVVLGALDLSRHVLVHDVPHLDIESEPISAVALRQIDEELRALSDKRPDLILWLGRSGTMSYYLPGIRQHLGSVLVMGGDALAPGRDLVAQAPGWGGVRYVDFFEPESTPELRAFRDRFLARFAASAGTAEVLSYDAMRLVLAAVASGARTGPEVRAWLLRLGDDLPPYTGLSGPIRFSPEGEVERPYVLVAIPTPP
ncbi:MAG: ABC transporter substrate-binding protein [Gemmatimonadales bacterium]